DDKATALAQSKKLLKNLSENIKRLDDNRDDNANETENQFDTHITRLEKIIDDLKVDRAKGIRPMSYNRRSRPDEQATQLPTWSHRERHQFSTTTTTAARYEIGTHTRSRTRKRRTARYCSNESSFILPHR
ncbi:Hypothetical protein, putative, partial [Bodo saltans]